MGKGEVNYKKYKRPSSSNPQGVHRELKNVRF
jgi:hypothetical protein